jgi:5-(carboxyamino)imidazole ribonucleotide mutase
MTEQPRVGVIMGSDSDWSVMSDASAALAEFDIAHEVGVYSAHRTPQRMLDYAQQAADRGIEVIIAGAGGAAHLPGMVASATPAGVPVATVSIGGARNAGLLAVRILAASDAELRERVVAFQKELAESVLAKDSALKQRRGKVTGE